MISSETPRFSDDTQRELYRYVERNGSVNVEAAREHIDADSERFHETLSSLVRRGDLEERSGTLRITLSTGDETTRTVDGIEYSIRPARQEDLSDLVKVVRHVADGDGYVVAGSIATALNYEAAVIRHSDAGSRVFFVAVDDGSVVGWTHLQAAERESTRHTARQTVGVLGPYRGYGIGSALLERGLQWAADHDRLKVYNSLPATNVDAMRFLEGHGWETEAIRRDHYVIDGELVDEVMMAAYPGATSRSH